MLSVNDIAVALNISPSLARKKIEAGEIPAENHAAPGARHKLWRVREDAFEAYRASRSNALAVAVEAKRKRRAAVACRPPSALNRLGI